MLVGFVNSNEVLILIVDNGGSTPYFSKPARIFSRLPNIGQALQYFLATGNLKSQSGLDMQQISGFSIVGDKLNYQRWLSHFRLVISRLASQSHCIQNCFIALQIIYRYRHPRSIGFRANYRWKSSEVP